MKAPTLVDWRLATATGVRLVPPGPRLSLGDASDVVDDLRRLADRADEHVATVTGLDVAAHSARTVVVDRPDWIRANVESFQLLVDPLLDTLVEKARLTRPNPVVGAIASRAAGLEVGALLGYLATRVLGQFELLGPSRRADDAPNSGRLTLVAPNIVATERLLRVDPADFRLWVCLHEVTHRTQFAAAPWLHQHVQDRMREFLLASDLDPSALLSRLRQALSGVVDTVRGRSDRSLVELIQTPEQREVLDRITGLMSLLEGHADVVMDAVGPAVVPSVATIRERFTRRRGSGGPIERAMRRLLGVDLKLKQYAEGARFVRTVVERIGMAGLNTVWSGPDQLPTGAEIRDPDGWLARVAPSRVVNRTPDPAVANGSQA